MNPPDLPNAMVIVQELESNNLRAQFANSFTSSQIMSQIYSGTKTQIKIPDKVTIVNIIAIREILTT